MERARITWTDERLDDLSARVDRGFDRIDDDIRVMRSELSVRINDLQRLMIQLTGGTIATILGTFVGAIIVG